MWVFWVWAVAIGVLIAGKLFWMIDDWGRDWTCNHAQLSTANADPQLHPFEISGDAVSVEAMIQGWVAEQSAWKILSVSLQPNGSDETALPPNQPAGRVRRLHLTHSSSIFRFVDDVHVEITQLESPPGQPPRCRVDAESRSRVGKGDLGQNPRNLKELRRGVLGK